MDSDEFELLEYDEDMEFIEEVFELFFHLLDFQELFPEEVFNGK